MVRATLREYCRSVSQVDDLSDIQTIIASALVASSPIVPKTPHPRSNPFDKVFTGRVQDDTPLGSLFNLVLGYLETYQPLMAVSEDLSEHFDFLARVIWPEVGEAISEGLGSVIFAAGRPDELHRVSSTFYR